MATENVSDGESHFHVHMIVVVRAPHKQTERAQLVVPCARSSARPPSPSWTSGVERLLADHSAQGKQRVARARGALAGARVDTLERLQQAFEAHLQQVDAGLRTVSRSVDSLVGTTERAAAVGARSGRSRCSTC